MSVEEAKRRLDFAIGDDQVAQDDLNILILEVQAAMPCYRLTRQPQHMHGPIDNGITGRDERCIGTALFCEHCGVKRALCLSCAAKATLKELTAVAANGGKIRA